MTFGEAMQACAVGAAVIAAGYGMLCVIRSGRWNHPGHWFGVVAVLWLASLAWPHNDAWPHNALQAPVVEQRPAVVSDAIVAALVRFQELKNGKP